MSLPVKYWCEGGYMRYPRLQLGGLRLIIEFAHLHTVLCCAASLLYLLDPSAEFTPILYQGSG